MSKNKNSYLLVVIDAFSKYVWLQPVPTSSVFELNNSNNYTDRGKAFTSQEFSNYCKPKQIRHTLNAVSCPRANGQVERSNRTILQPLIAYTGDNSEDWEQFIPQVKKVSITV